MLFGVHLALRLKNTMIFERLKSFEGKHLNRM